MLDIESVIGKNCMEIQKTKLQRRFSSIYIILNYFKLFKLNKKSIKNMYHLVLFRSSCPRIIHF